MEVIGHNHNGIDVEHTLTPHGAKRLTPFIDAFYQQARLSIAERDGEEIGRSRNTRTAVIHHRSFYRFARILRIRNGCPVHIDRASAVRTIWPPPSPSEPCTIDLEHH
jgi:hypothetical protein